MCKNFFKHLHTINKHRRLVRKYCFKCGLIIRGLLHDLSKYSREEFFPSCKYYQGFRSPTTEERRNEGYSKAWLHHKGRNKHHPEYWVDFNQTTRKYEPVEMPKEYLVECFCDRIAASKVYLKEAYTDESPLKYHIEKDDYLPIHPTTKKQLIFLLTMLKEKGEIFTFKYIKQNFKKNDFLKDIE